MSTTTSSQPKCHGFNGFTVPPILSWKNPYETGTLLAEVLGIFIILSSSFSLRLFLKIVSSTVGVLSIVEWGSRAISGQRQGLILNYKPSRFLPLSDSVIQDITNYVTYAVRRVSYTVEQLVDARYPAKGLRLAGVLYVAYVLLGIFSLKNLILVSIILAFGVPPVYLQFKPQVDKSISELLGKACKETKVVTDKVYQKAGPLIKKVEKALGVRGGFPGTANHQPVKDIPTAAAQSTAYTSSSNVNSASAASTTARSTEAAHEAVHNFSHEAGASSVGAVPTATTTTTTTTTTTAAPIDEIKGFTSVPTLVGNVPIDQEKLNAALAADKAKQEGSVNL